VASTGIGVVLFPKTGYDKWMDFELKDGSPFVGMNHRFIVDEE
jgi:hypothetical protein